MTTTLGQETADHGGEALPPKILALDLATRFGWAVGSAGEKPTSGSRFFTRDGRPPKGGAISNGAKFWNVMRFATEIYKQHQPTHVVCEAPIAPNAKSGQTSTDTFEILYGLPAVFRGMLFGLGCFDWSYAHASAVRKHFIGKGNLKGDEAKPLVFRKCVALGWINPVEDEDLSHDRSDALAVWSWAEAKLAPRMAQPVDDLFLRAKRRQS